MKHPDLSIIIVSYNTCDITLQTIKSIVRSTPQTKLSYEIIVVDNNSSDDSVASIRRHFPDVKVLDQTKNLGFGKANNLGVKAATGEYVALINSDCIINDTSLIPLVDYLKQNPKCGLVAPKLLLEDNQTPQSAAVGAEPTLLTLVTRNQSKYDDVLTSQSTPFHPDWVTGAAMVLPKKVYETIGGFDEAMFMYYEDVDLCRRVKEAGYDITWIPEATLVHLGGKSSPSTWGRKKRYYQAQLYYFRKHHGLGMAVLVWIIRLPFVIRYRFFG